MIPIFLLHGVLTVLSFIVMLSYSDLPGGEVGMTPLLVMILVLAQFIIGVIGYRILRKKVSDKNQKIYFLVAYSFIYWILLYFILKDFNFYETSLDSIKGGLYRRYYLTNLISTICVLCILNLTKLGHE